MRSLLIPTIALVLTVPASGPGDRLSSLATRYAERPTSVTCHRFGSMVAGDAQLLPDGSARIRLAPDVCAALRVAPRLVAPNWPRAASGAAVHVLGHEIGHASGRTDENAADCYSVRHVRRLALDLGYNRADLPALMHQASAYSFCEEGR